MKRLESLEAWKVGHDVAERLYRLTLTSPLDRHYALADQIRRAALSVPANIAEGYALGTRAQLVRCLRIALGSAAELTVHVRLLQRLKLADEQRVAEIVSACSRLVALLIGLLRRLGARVPDSSR